MTGHKLLEVASYVNSQPVRLQFAFPYAGSTRQRRGVTTPGPMLVNPGPSFRLPQALNPKPKLFFQRVAATVASPGGWSGRGWDTELQLSFKQVVAYNAEQTLACLSCDFTGKKCTLSDCATAIPNGSDS